MQEWTNPQRSSIRQPARNIMTYSLLCFSLAGLIFGFATGGFLGRSPQAPNTAPKTTISTVHHTPTPTLAPSPTPENVVLNPPVVQHISTSEKADGSTSYTFAAQPIYKTPLNKPIDVTDVVCRFWLTADLDGTNAALSANRYAILQDIHGLTQPFPQETVGGLLLTPPSTQVQPCVPNGNTTWTYQVSPSVQPGTYYLFILADWRGIHFNLSARQIQITN